MKTPILSLAGQLANGLNNTATRYAGMVMGALAANYQSSATQADFRMPVAGTFSKLHIRFPVPGSGKSWAVTLLVDGVASSLTATQANTEAEKTSAATVSVSAGQRVCWQITPSGTPAGSAAAAQISAEFEATSAGESIVFAGTSITSTGVSDYLQPGCFDVSQTENLASMVIPAAGTLDKLYVHAHGAPGVGKSRSITVYKNGAATSLTTSLVDSATTAEDTNVAHAVSVVAGDLISIQTTPTGTPSNASLKCSLRWVPTTTGEALLLAGTSAAFSSSAVRYMNVNGSSNNTATEADAYNVAPTAFGVKNLRVKLNVAPGSGKSRAFTLRANGSSQSLTATVSDTATTASDTDAGHAYTTTAGDVLDWITTPSGTPADEQSAKVSAVAYTGGGGGGGGLPTTVTFGRKTRPGMGDIPIARNGETGWSITSGNTSNHWEIDSGTGVLRTKTGGSWTDLNSSYTLGLSYTGGTHTLTVNTTAGEYSVAPSASETQLKTTTEYASLARGEVIRLRKGDYNTSQADLRTKRSSAPSGSGYVRITCDLNEDHEAVIHYWHMDGIFGGTKYFEFYSVAFDRMPASTPVDGVSGACLRCDNGTISDIIVRECTFVSNPSADGSVDAQAYAGIYILGPNNGIYDCTFEDVWNGITAGNCNNLEIIGNTLRRVWRDGMAIGIGNNIKVNWNVITDKKHPTNSDPHADFVQFDHTGATADVDGIEIIGNRFWRGAGTSGEIDGQGIFIDDIPSPHHVLNVVIEANMVLCSLVRGISVTRGMDPVIRFNTAVTEPTYAGDASTGIHLETCDGGEVQYNVVAANVANNSNTGTATIANNSVLNDGGTNGTVSSGYTTEFVNPDKDSAVTDVVSQYAIKSGSASHNANPKRGAAGTAYVNYATRSYSPPV